MKSLEKLLATLLIAGTCLFSNPRYDSPMIENKDHTPPKTQLFDASQTCVDSSIWFRRTMDDARNYLQHGLYTSLDKEYRPSVVDLGINNEPEDMEDMLDLDELEEFYDITPLIPTPPRFFGYNHIGEPYFSRVTYTTLSETGTWIKEPFDGELFEEDLDESVGEYCEYIKNFKGDYPLLLPLNTAPIVDDIVFYPIELKYNIENWFEEYISNKMVFKEVYEDSGDFYINLDSKSDGLLCYSVARHNPQNVPFDFTVPFEVSYTEDVKTKIDLLEGDIATDDLYDFVEMIEPRLEELFDYEANVSIEQKYDEFYNSDSQKDLLTFVFNDMNGKGDCDVHNTVGGIIIRDSFEIGTAEHIGEVCWNPRTCVQYDLYIHGYMTISDDDGKRIILDVTGSVKED